MRGKSSAGGRVSLSVSLCLSLAKTVKNRHAASISVYNNRLSATWTARWHQNYKQLPSHRRHCFRYFLRISRGARTAGTSKVFWSVPRCRCHDSCAGVDGQLRSVLQCQQADTAETRSKLIYCGRHFSLCCVPLLCSPICAELIWPNCALNAPYKVVVFCLCEVQIIVTGYVFGMTVFWLQDALTNLIIIIVFK